MTGFVVVVALAAALLLLLVARGSADTEVATTAATDDRSVPPTGEAAPEPTPVPTTEPIEVPAETVQLVSLDTEPPAADAEAAADAGASLSAALTAAGNEVLADGSPQTLGAETDVDAAGSDTAAANAVPAAGPQSTVGSAAQPSPAPPAAGPTTDGDGPGAAAPAPEPSPTATAVPNPQPAAPVDVPPPNPSTGTFTHTLTAVVAQPTLHTAPGGSTFMPTFNGTALPPVNPTVFGNPLVYRVIAGTPGDTWAQVYVPARPNGTTAWVQTSQFTWGSSNRMIEINISSNTVTVFEGSSVLLSSSAVTGSSASRTPVAAGWVEETMAGPSSAYGPLLISLGLFSEDLNSFGGGIPKIALHGTNNPSLMGQSVSNGCIRVPNEIITQIAGMIAPGSKVIITR
ncbi:MAG: L,D-transpeptidase [Actinomycetota bacterium]